MHDGARERVVAVSPRAAAHGVAPGQTLSAARALCSGLVALRLEPEADARLLARLAAALLRFTPDVCRERDPALRAGAAGLLLEVGRTAFHFGGEESLATQVTAACARAGFATQLGIADTPEAARVLARAGELAGDPEPRHAPRAGTGLFAALPWQALAPSVEVAAACRALGVRTIGELLQLPRAGLATRTSIAFVQQLQRLLGELEEPLERIAPPQFFDEELEFEAPVNDAGALLVAAQQLLTEAVEALAARGEAPLVAAFTFVPPGKAPPWSLDLAPSAPTRDVALLVTLLSHRLEHEQRQRRQAVALVEKVRLVVAKTVPLAAEQEALFAAGRDRGAERTAAALIDRLAMRLGREQVRGVEARCDPRPERAFGWRAAGAVATSAAQQPVAGARPFELAGAPQPCAVTCDERGQPLRAVRGPERITGGWWDGNDVERDYFEVELADGTRSWIFRDAAGAWFRHGAFS